MDCARRETVKVRNSFKPGLVWLCALSLVGLGGGGETESVMVSPLELSGDFVWTQTSHVWRQMLSTSLRGHLA